METSLYFLRYHLCCKAFSKCTSFPSDTNTIEYKKAFDSDTRTDGERKTNERSFVRIKRTNVIATFTDVRGEHMLDHLLWNCSHYVRIQSVFISLSPRVSVQCEPLRTQYVFLECQWTLLERLCVWFEQNSVCSLYVRHSLERPSQMLFALSSVSVGRKVCTFWKRFTT